MFLSQDKVIAEFEHIKVTQIQSTSSSFLHIEDAEIVAVRNSEITQNTVFEEQVSIIYA